MSEIVRVDDQLRGVSARVLLFLGCVWGCGENAPSNDCSSLNIAVTARAPDPIFEWSSACPAALLIVTPPDSLGMLVWSAAAAPGKNAIRGPVTYGQVVPGMMVMTPADPLASGREYRVQISRIDDHFGMGFQEMGAAVFTLP